jgi:hypothetical protein
VLKEMHSTLPAEPDLVLPERVTRRWANWPVPPGRGLLALAVGTGIAVLASYLGANGERLDQSLCKPSTPH